VKLLRSLAACATTLACSTFSASALADVIDFSKTDLNEVSLGPGGYHTELISNGVNISAARGQGMGIGGAAPWNGGEGNPGEAAPANYWETYSISVDSDPNNGSPGFPYDWAFNIHGYTDESGTTYLDLSIQTDLIVIGAEGGTFTLDPDGNFGTSSYNINVDLDASWVDFGNGHISLSSYGNIETTPGFHTVRYVEIESGFFQSAHLVYTVTSVPEPETCAMLLAGLGIVGAVARRRRKLN